MAIPIALASSSVFLAHAASQKEKMAPPLHKALHKIALSRNVHADLEKA
jgi:hypothetical protein